MLSTLNQRATVLAREAVPDGAGGMGENWVAQGVVWVSLAPLTGNDLFGPDADESRVRHRVTARRYSLLQAGCRLSLFPSRTLRIHAVLDEGPQAQFVTLLCEELP